MTKNKLLRTIANNTGGNVSTMKNKLSLLKTIASNLGATVTGNTKNEITYLQMIAEGTEDYQSLDDYVVVIGDKNVIQSEDTVTLRARVFVDGKSVSGKTVNFYVEDS